MKTTDFINESFVEDAVEAHQDHEVQMARGDCYNAAKYAIELHKLLKNISEQQGLDGWVSEKITLANDYLRTVTEYLRYEQQSGSSSDMPDFNVRSATQTLDSVLGEGQEASKGSGFFTWYLKKDGELITPYTSTKPYTFNSKEEAIKWAKEKFKVSYDQGKIFPTANPEANLSPTVGPIDSYVGVKEEEDEEPKQKRKPVVIKTNKPVGSRVADIGPGGKEYNVKTDKAWDDQHKEVDEGKADPTGSWVVYNGTTVKRFKTRDGAKAYAEKNGGKVASSEFYADNVQKQDMAEDMSRAAKGHEKYGKAGMQALAKAGREGASEKELDTIRDKHDRYDESAGGMGAGSVATSMGGGNGFANGGPGTIARPKMKKKK